MVEIRLRPPRITVSGGRVVKFELWMLFNYRENKICDIERLEDGFVYRIYDPEPDTMTDFKLERNFQQFTGKTLKKVLNAYPDTALVQYEKLFNLGNPTEEMIRNVGLSGPRAYVAYV